ncbi:MAG: hypothetical protein PHR77_17760, partial [Kiritimatiellae bacterium]|nr:hypothetical protein [Kiritimatiellia bacterium]
NALCKIMVGDRDDAMRIESVKVEDRLSNLRIMKGGFATYKIPLKTGCEDVRHIAMIARSNTMVELSQNGQTWTTAEKSVSKGGVMLFDFTPNPQAGDNLFLKVKAPDNNETRLYGFALLR